MEDNDLVEKDLKIGWLLDFYSAFLTRNQKSVLDLYYNMDYSLAEIAEKEGITRQGVLDTKLKNTKERKAVLEEESIPATQSKNISPKISKPKEIKRQKEKSRFCIRQTKEATGG